MSPKANWSTEVVGVLVTAAFVAGILFDTLLSKPKSPPKEAAPAAEAVSLPLKTENYLLRARLTVETQSRFERQMRLRASLDNCEDRDGTHYCTAMTDPGLSIVSYHCTVDRCVMDCTK